MNIENYIEKLKLDNITDKEYDKLVNVFGNDVVNDYFEKVLASNDKNKINIINKIIEMNVSYDLEDDIDLFDDTNSTFVSSTVSSYLNQIRDIRVLTKEEEQEFGKILMENKDVFDIPVGDKNNIFVKKMINKQEEVVIDLEKIFSSITNEEDQKDILKLLNNYYSDEIWNKNFTDKIIRNYILSYEKLADKVGVPTISCLNNELSNIENNNIFNNYSYDKRVDDVSLLKDNLKKYFKYMYVRDKMIYYNLKLAFSVAKRFAGGYDLMDTVGNANIGLMKAVEKFDYTRKTKFSTYAVWWIKQAIFRSRTDNDTLIRLPVHIHESMEKIRKYINSYTFKKGVEPSIEVIAKDLGMDESKVKDIIMLRKDYLAPLSLNNKLKEEDDTELIDFVETKDFDVYDEVSSLELKSTVKEILSRLSERDRNIIMLRFGIGYDSAMTLEEVGKQYGITRERVRQIESKALRKLRASASREKLDDFMD